MEILVAAVSMNCQYPSLGHQSREYSVPSTTLDVSTLIGGLSFKLDNAATWHHTTGIRELSIGTASSCQHATISIDLQTCATFNLRLSVAITVSNSQQLLPAAIASKLPASFYSQQQFSVTPVRNNCQHLSAAMASSNCQHQLSAATLSNTCQHQLSVVTVSRKCGVEVAIFAGR